MQARIGIVAVGGDAGAHHRRRSQIVAEDGTGVGHVHLGNGSAGCGGTLHGSQEVIDLVGGEVLTVRGVCQGKVREDSLELEVGLPVDEVCQT